MVIVYIDIVFTASGGVCGGDCAGPAVGRAAGVCHAGGGPPRGHPLLRDAQVGPIPLPAGLERRRVTGLLLPVSLRWRPHYAVQL